MSFCVFRALFSSCFGRMVVVNTSGTSNIDWLLILLAWYLAGHLKLLKSSGQLGVFRYQ